ncbi:MAG TPA: response regulator [Candidatus Dormibacteraeota bacterium]|nr:response regulator [Candidatus Dormibacteraeota bacterium]
MPPQPRVLMLEDHPDIADLYQLKLQLEGYRVAVASDGAAGLRMARSLIPDLILLDIHMPQLDGLQVLAALREDTATDEVPVVVCSEDDSPQLIREAHRLGAVAYLVKANLLPSRLSKTVSDVLGQRGEFTVQADRARARRAS